MKRCPVCKKTYEYEALRFCRFDGAHLEDDVSWREAPTILLEPHEIPHVESVTGEHKIYR